MAKKKKGKSKKKKYVAAKRELVYKNYAEEYGVITKKLGDRRMMVSLISGGPDVMGIIPGRFRRRCWFDIGDLILTSSREFQKGKLDIIYKYRPEEKRLLIKYGEVPPAFDITGPDNTEEEETGIVFELDDIFDEI